MKIAHFRFGEDLRLLLSANRASGEFEYPFNGPQSVKHLVESAGIPHTEIGGILANGMPVSVGYLVRDGDTVDVRAARPGVPATEPGFILDGHLGRLVSHLRMLGLDCLYENDYDDAVLEQISREDQRILLTRDRRLLMRKSIELGYLVRNLDPWQQFHEVVQRFGLRAWIRPFQRCIRCNHLLESVDKTAVMDRLEPLTRRYYDEFRICPACRQIYWKGSHFEKMQQIVAALGT